MDIRERWQSTEETIRAAIEGALANLWTAVPVTINSYDPAKQTVSAQPTVKGIVRKPDGTTEHVNLPLLQDCPVHFPSGGGATMTFPIKAGDEGLAIIASRSIDAWHQSGDVQRQTDARMHDLSDAMILVGFKSNPKALQNVSADAVQMRSDDGAHVVELHPSNGLKLASSARISIEGPGLDIAGSLNVTGDVVAGAGSAAISLLQHHHGGVQPGSANTAIPNGNG